MSPMQILRMMVRLFMGEPYDKSITLDRLPVRARKRKKGQHERKLREASAKYGKPFKAAAMGLPREVMVEGKLQVMDATRVADVRPIKKKSEA